MMNNNIEPYNDKTEPHGYWQIYYGNSKIMYKCFWVNGRSVGYEEWYWNCEDEHELSEKIYYII